MRKVLGVFLVTLFWIATAMADERQKIDNGFSYYQKDFQSGSQGVLIVEKTLPASAINQNVAKPRLGVDKSNVDANLAVLKQFVELATAAETRGETLTKDFGLVRAFSFGMYDYWNQFEIVTTTDSSSHLGYALKITSATKVLFKVVPTAVDPANANDFVFPFSYNLEEVRSLIALLVSYQEGKLNSESSIVNQASESLLEKTAGFQKGKTTLAETKMLLGDPVQSMEMPEDSIRIDYAERHSGRGQSITLVLIFDKKERLREKIVFKW